MQTPYDTLLISLNQKFMTTRLFQKLIALALCFSFTLQVNAQTRNCASHDILLEQQQQDPKRINKLRQIEEQTQNYIRRGQQRAVNGIVTIPVVVHIVYRTSTQNISDSQIQSQLTVLNDDFRRFNSDANGTWSQAADSEIEFCLATVDPNGNPTSGITRTSTNVSGFGTNDAVKSASSGGVNAWSTSDYLNIWVCDIGGGILGYAQFPGGNPATDGVVNDYRYFGTNGTATAPFNLGRTMTHEVGHYLNLRHIWGDGNCNVDDFVSDTPTSDAPNYGCASSHVSCSSLDMVQNYMDYSDDGCMNLFTTGQKNRMRAIFDTGGARASLLNSGACGAATNPTCSDGIQNQGETGVDCGGPCAPCQTACTGNEVNFSITFDNYPEETSWTLTTDAGVSIDAGGTYANQADGSTLALDFCLTDGCYDLTINDAYGDGICCSYGSGSYTITDGNGNVLGSGGSFASSETSSFCFGGGPVATCSDGIQNQGETGIDCGGPCTACATCDDGIQNQGETGVDCGGPCTACPTCDDGIQNQGETGVDCGGPCAPCNTGGGCVDVVIDEEDFDSGWGNWNDGGSDCVRSTASSYANSGTRTIRLRDNTNSSVATTDVLNLAGFEQVDIEFTYVGRSMENGEDFWLQASLDNGAWQTLFTWASGSDFTNLVREFEFVSITGNFTSNTRFRFRCDASSNADYVYIDDVFISGCTNGSARDAGTVLNDSAAEVETMRLFPNPANQILNVGFTTPEVTEVTLQITDFSGKVVMVKELTSILGEQLETVNTAELSAGFYFANIITPKGIQTQKFVVVHNP